MGNANSQFVDINIHTDLYEWEISRLIAGNNLRVEKKGKIWQSESISTSGKLLQIKLRNPDYTGL